MNSAFCQQEFFPLWQVHDMIDLTHTHTGIMGWLADQKKSPLQHDAPCTIQEKVWLLKDVNNMQNILNRSNLKAGKV